MAEERGARLPLEAVGDPALRATASPPVGPSHDSMGALDPRLYVPQELRQPSRRDTYEVDDAINIIEEGEHVSAEDFGLSSTEISMNAPIAMNVAMELNAMQQIDAFLASRPSSELMANDPTPPHHHQQEQHDAQCADASGTNTSSSTREVVVSPRGDVTADPQDLAASASKNSPSSTNHETPSSSRDAPMQYPTRRDDKVLQLESHPLVASVASDGRSIMCKCGKSVRLNPAWYITKYEQHIVSRNCTFLRKKKTKRDQEAQEKRATAPAGSTNVGSDQPNGESADQQSASAEASHGQLVESASDTVAQHESDDHYGLKTSDELSRKLATQTGGGENVETGDLPDRRLEKEKLFHTLRELQAHPHFGRITPDGKFLECKCSELIILSVPWVLREFLAHVEAKSKQPAPTRRKLPTGASISKPRLGDGAAHRVEQRLIVRETRWKPVSKHAELPCPGLRGERINVYINSTTKTTGGGRARRRVAEDLFPHHFAAAQMGKKVRPRLTTEEKVMLRDAVESEALWFIDHDAGAVRSLDCRGSIAINKAEGCCASCAELRSNASLRISVTVAIGNKRIPDDAIGVSDTTGAQTKPKGSTAGFALLEQEFDMTEEYARLLRDLFRADVEESSVKNMWFDMAELGMTGFFAAHPAFLGLLESMMALKEKERRGVGMQNMSYSDHLDTFMKSIADISPQACDFFQQKLGGRKQKYLMLAKRRKVDERETDATTILTTTTSQEQAPPDAVSVDSTDNGLNVSSEGFSSLPFDLTSAASMHNLADMHDVDLSSFQSEQHQSVPTPLSADTTADNEETDAFLTDENLEVEQEDIDDGSTCDPPAPALTAPTIAPGFMPCRGLREPKVQAYVVNAVQIIGGSRPKYVIAKELFPEAFDGSRKVKITEKLSEHERGIVLDAIFSECLWRVDRASNCVRSLRCFRRVDKKRGNGVCRACLELKSIANFRSVLCRAKVPKKVENLKYVPSVYTESDPFMRKLSKNASLRVLYQTVKRTAPEDKKKVLFWLRLAKMGLFGSFRSHVVFEGLIASMVEIKDRERRGVGKQNMLYAKSLDVFMAELAAISMDAFELFSHQFCGRSLRSQKVKKRKALTQLYDSSIQQAMGATSSLAMASSAPASVAPASVSLEIAMTQMPVATTIVPSTVIQSSTTTPTVPASAADPHTMMMSEDLLGPARPITTAEMEENQRFMDRMLDEVRLSVTHDEHEPDEHLDPQTYLDENGVLTTVL